MRFVVITDIGELTKVIKCPSLEIAEAMCSAEETVMEFPEGLSPTKTYVLDDVFLNRPEMGLSVGGINLAVGSDFLIENIPEGTTVKYPGGEVVVDDGVIEWTTDEPGTYEFRLTNFPYMEEVLRATFTEA